MMTEFDGVHPALRQALLKRGYETLTPVQQEVLMPELVDADALVSAQTGSGKTVAFGLALAPTLLGDADRFARADKPFALIIAPTRELALQVKRELEWLYEPTGAKVASCVGGMDMRTERTNLTRGAHIVVGTPGRLRDHIERGSLDTGTLRGVVLDEADEMLDLGFREDLEYILDAAPTDRRTLLFSATVPKTIANLAKRYQRDAIRITTAAEQKQHVDIDYQALLIAPNDKENAIVNVLRFYEPKNALIFCATRMAVNHMTSRFINRGFSVVALSGELSQKERTNALQSMRDGRAQVCIATDVAARGIDLPNLELVVHADMPKTGETLLHRSGRTGRAGRKGVCTLIVPYNWRRRVERLLDSAKIEATWGKPPSVDDILQRDRERILENPALQEPAGEFETEFALDLIAQYGAEQVAAAFVRQHLAGLTAPEELLDTDKQENKQTRVDFENGQWFSLSVGRKDNAEVRWLLPMLCRVGHLTKGQVGAIRVAQTETFVELHPDCVDKFVDAIGPTATVEETIKIVALDGKPDLGEAPVQEDFRSGRGGKPFRKKKPFAGRKDKDSHRGQAPRKPRREEKADWSEEHFRDKPPSRAKKKVSKKADKKPIKKKKVKKKPGSLSGDAPLRRKR